MRGTVWFILMCLFGVSFSFLRAQESNENDIIESIKAPSSPASQILNAQPNTITRPKSWNEFEASVFTDLLSENGNINLSRAINIELSPYWLTKNRKISNEDYIFQRDPIENLKQNFTLSLATMNNLVIPDSLGQKNSAIGIGFRTMLWRGTKLELKELDRRYDLLKKDLQYTTRLLPVLFKAKCNNCTKEEYVNDLQGVIEEEKDNLFTDSFSNELKNDIIKNFIEYLLENLPDKSIDGSDYRSLINSISEENFFSKLNVNLLTLQEMISDRKGFKLEIAGALAIDFPTQETDFSVIPQYAFWITPSYQPFDTEWIEFLGVLRYQGFELDYYLPILNQSESKVNAFDLGVKLVFKSKKISLELEGISRREKNETVLNGEFIDDTQSETKYVVRLNYRVSDNLIFTYDFGRDFETLTNPNTNLISLFSIGYALGSTRKTDINYGDFK